MPTYDYACRACDHEFEFFKVRSDEPLPDKCPECQSDKIEKLISKKTTFILKGKGWFDGGY